MKFLISYNKRSSDGIYIIKNSIDEKVYIGECKNFYKRFGRHLSQLRRGVHYNSKLQNFVNKYGIDILSFDIIEEMPGSSSDERVDKEIFYIRKYNSIDAGFNLVEDSRLMAHITEEARQKSSKSLLGIKRDEDFKEKVKEGLKEYYLNHPNIKRKPWSEDRKRKRRQYIKEHPEKYKDREASSGNRINHKRGEESPFTKLTNDTVLKIKEAIANGEKRRDIIVKFDITIDIYKSIQSGKSWKSVIYEKDKNKKEK